MLVILVAWWDCFFKLTIHPLYVQQQKRYKRSWNEDFEKRSIHKYDECPNLECGLIKLVKGKKFASQKVLGRAEIYYDGAIPKVVSTPISGQRQL